MLRFSLLGLLGVVLFAAIGCAALVSTVRWPGSAAAGWWGSSVATMTLLAWGVCLLAAVFQKSKSRTAAAGALIAAAAYWLFAFSPWLGPNVGKKLITSRLIGLAEQKLSAQNAQQQLSQPGMVQVWDATTGTPTLTWTTTYTPLLSYPPQPGTNVATPNTSAFAEVAHHLLMWPLALLGALLAGFVYARSRGQNSATAPAAAANPQDKLDAPH